MLPIPCSPDELELDFSFFVNNNPLQIELAGVLTESMNPASKDDGGAESNQSWISLISLPVKLAGGQTLRQAFSAPKEPIDRLRLRIYPDGGINRLRLWVTLEGDQLAHHLSTLENQEE